MIRRFYIAGDKVEWVSCEFCFYFIPSSDEITTLVNISLDRTENVSSNRKYLEKVFEMGSLSFWSAFQNNRHILLIKKLISVTRNIAIQGSIQFYRKFSWKEGVGCDDFHVWRISCSSSIFDTWNKPWNSRRQATAWRRRRRRVIREPNRFVLMKFLDAVSSWHSSAERVTWLFIEFQRRTTPGRGEPSLLAPCLRGIKLALRGNN